MDPAAPLAARPAPAWPRVGAVLSGAFDLLTQARLRIRDGALYIGSLGLLVLGPVAVATIAEIPRFAVSASGRLTGPGPSAALVLAWGIGLVGAVAVGIEAQIIVISILGGARVGRPLSLWEALRRSRTVFWRAFWAIAGVGFVTGIVSSLVSLADPAGLRRGRRCQLGQREPPDRRDRRPAGLRAGRGRPGGRRAGRGDPSVRAPGQGAFPAGPDVLRLRGRDPVRPDHRRPDRARPRGPAARAAPRPARAARPEQPRRPGCRREPGSSSRSSPTGP